MRALVVMRAVQAVVTSRLYSLNNEVRKRAFAGREPHEETLTKQARADYLADEHAALMADVRELLAAESVARTADTWDEIMAAVHRRDAAFDRLGVDP